jgi:hypothetical protein
MTEYHARLDFYTLINPYNTAICNFLTEFTITVVPRIFPIHRHDDTHPSGATT